MTKFPVWLVVLALAAPRVALADVDITVAHGVVWQTSKAGDSSQGFLQIRNSGTVADMLTGWDCPVADATALVDGTGKSLANLVIPAGQTVILGGSGPHLLLNSARYIMEYGSVAPCSFTFQNAGDIGAYLYAIPAPGGR